MPQVNNIMMLASTTRYFANHLTNIALVNVNFVLIRKSYIYTSFARNIGTDMYVNDQYVKSFFNTKHI